MNPYDPNLFAIDPCVIVDFNWIGEPNFFSQVLPGKVLVSDFAYSELAESQVPANGVQIIAIQEEDIGNFVGLTRCSPTLGVAELGSIFIALKARARLISNDCLVQNVAQALGVYVWGTLAFLEYAIGAGLVLAMQAIEIVEELAKSVCWMSVVEAERFKGQYLKEATAAHT